MTNFSPFSLSAASWLHQGACHSPRSALFSGDLCCGIPGLFPVKGLFLPNLSANIQWTFRVPEPDTGYSLSRIFPPPGQTSARCPCAQALWSQGWPSVHACMSVLGLMVTSSEAMLSVQFHSRLLWLNILAACGKQTWSLNCLMQLIFPDVDFNPVQESGRPFPIRI